MAYNNFLIEQNNQSYKLQKILTSVYFDDVLENLPKQDWKHKDIKYR